MRNLLVRLAAALIALQALWSGGAAAATSAGVDAARLLCATLQPSAEARRAVAEIAAIAGLSAPDEPSSPDFAAHDCAACFAAAAAIIAPDAGPLARALGAPSRTAVERGVLVGGRGLAGPPLGSRAPPQA